MTKIAGRVRQLVTTSGPRPGDCLPDELGPCDNLGVSRSSLREAVRTLSVLEIVEVQHGQGTFVGNATLRPLMETLTFYISVLLGKHRHMPLEVVKVRRGINLGEAEQVCSTLRGIGDEELHWLVNRIAGTTGEGKPFVESGRGFYVTLMDRADRRIIADLATAC